LESVYAGNRIAGSNPAPSANHPLVSKYASLAPQNPCVLGDLAVVHQN